ncbi:trafficking protein particle complex subunit 6B-like [Physella acuta]|uniref:trafficking protein particle complex subunit 6B-like n=1 Tax=Physella acuta TaxID=109671 RepID=UPI0027DD0478|nr:trafficking protein particle complex subunit 6B-like [Physella acuta]
MAHEDIFVFFHMEMVDFIHREASLSKDNTQKEKWISKLETLGYHVGQRLIERFTKESSHFKDELDVIKFICKDLWNYIYKKQVDNLRKYQQGVYVLQDNKFTLLVQMSTGIQYMESAAQYLAFPCGLIRGALSNLGVNCIVTAQVSAIPACKFQIQIQKT